MRIEKQGLFKQSPTSHRTGLNIYANITQLHLLDSQSCKRDCYS